ncbi:TetR/AcrR family transcriptional regulator [Planomonospora sp. ID67723]|uniref:TetR/AcrR family transcriptional regulator n=1 Tax=Planomonospora sp. ID67723 TaxID=2738134 RepID=UPI0018C3A045|nr:TetR/AcrR family transcriptional regulator [Planomonospora sp. ID67723]MBG0829004.1 TetR/AcrR family transcriptional regulator [Planomonospora sp. ID67723]
MSEASVNGPSEAVRGRPRDPRVEERVALAVIGLLLEAGYRQTTIEAVARRSGVSRPAIYRRWRSKAEVVAHALFARSDSTALRDSGDLREDLRAWTRAVLARFGRPEIAAAFPGLLADLQDEKRSRTGGDRSRTGAAQQDGNGPQGGFHVDLVGPRRRHFARTVEAAAARGELRPGADHEVLFELLVGSVFLRVASGGNVDDPAYEDRLVDLLYHAVARIAPT